MALEGFGALLYLELLLRPFLIGGRRPQPRVSGFQSLEQPSFRPLFAHALRLRRTFFRRYFFRGRFLLGGHCLPPLWMIGNCFYAPVRNADQLPCDQWLNPASKPKQSLEMASEPSGGHFD